MKTLRDKINEGFFNNIGVKEFIFLKELKDMLDNWKASSDKDFPINQLDLLCYKAQKENLNFDIYIENNLKSSPKNLYGLIIKFWNGFYEVSDKPDGRPANNDCWTVYYASSNNTHDIDTFNPKPRAIDSNIYRVGDRITHYVNTYADGSKRNITFKVRISLDNPKHTKWM